MKVQTSCETYWAVSKMLPSEAPFKLSQTKCQPMHLLLIKNNNQPHQTKNIKQCMYSLQQV